MIYVYERVLEHTGSSNLVSGNIKSGVKIFNVTGSLVGLSSTPGIIPFPGITPIKNYNGYPYTSAFWAETINGYDFIVFGDSFAYRTSSASNKWTVRNSVVSEDVIERIFYAGSRFFFVAKTARSSTDSITVYYASSPSSSLSTYTTFSSSYMSSEQITGIGNYVFWSQGSYNDATFKTYRADATASSGSSSTTVEFSASSVNSYHLAASGSTIIIVGRTRFGSTSICYISTDSGNNFSGPYSVPCGLPSHILINGSTIICCTGASDTHAVSTDTGKTWTKLGSSSLYHCYRTTYNAIRKKYYGYVRQTGLMESSNGITWTKVVTNSSSVYCIPSSIATSPSIFILDVDGTCYAYI